MKIVNLRTEISKKLNSNLSIFNLKNINFEIQPGQVLTLIGRSGSGKSTLLRCLAELEPYKKDNPEKYEHVGFVFQSANLFPHLNLTENISLALRKVQNKSESEISKIVLDVLNLVRLENRAEHYPHQLSGGENQRGAIARTLALQPKIIFYDEPTSSLDPELVDEVLEIILKLKKTNITQIVVTHELKALRQISDHVGFMKDGELKLFCKANELLEKVKNLDGSDQKYVELFL